MATTKTRSTNGKGPSELAAKPREVGQAVSSVARDARAPLLAAGAAAAGLAGGLALGARRGSRHRGLTKALAPRRTLLGIPLGPKPPALRALEALGKGAKRLGSTTAQVSDATDEIRQVREQVEQANHQSPIEVLLDGLTHRRGGHRRES
jgi:hypothetical protein